MKITSFGEVLWDNLPSGKKLGGAPLNVLVRLRALGADCAIISSRGADADGDEIQRQIEEKNVSTALLQTCPDQPTSLVEVAINKPPMTSCTHAPGTGSRFGTRRWRGWPSRMPSCSAVCARGIR